MGFLAPEALIVARLEERIALADWGARRVPRVLTAADAANVEERSQLAPAYYVVLDNYAPTQVQGNGRVQQIEQQWVIYSVLRNAIRHDSAQGVRDDAHMLIDLAISALCGFVVHSDFAPLSMLADTGPIYSDAGFGYFPLRFATRCVVRGA
jgi:hypothetical protein